MSKTIEEIITEKEQELGLNEEQLKAIKDYATKSSKFISLYQPLIDESAKAEDAIKAKKLSVAMKTTKGVLKGVGIVANVSIYTQQGDSLPRY